METTHPDTSRAGSGPVKRETPNQDSIRDTIESIVVAFIMAFVFRAFVVEAFVIPTGSMAPSLYGKHGQHRCAMCQYPFTYGIRERAPNGEHRGTLDREFSLRCPNCTWDGEGNSRLNTSDNPVVADSGDRILVLKWPYDLGGRWLGPQRWDVLVFKDPQDGETNFIKRLIGVPGEVLELINGDVYTAPLELVSEDIAEALLQPPPSRAVDRRLTDEQSARLAKILKIQRKAQVAQESLWMLHYDHDYPPQVRRGRSTGYFDPPHWQGMTPAARAAWDASMPVVRFQPPDANIHWLELRGKPIMDDYGYNNVDYQKSKYDSARHVGDVRLKFTLFLGKGDGYLTLELGKGKDLFRVRIDTDARVHLARSGTRGVWIKMQERRLASVDRSKPLAIEFENLDHRLTFRVNGQEVLQTDDDQYQPNVARLLRTSYTDGRDSEASVRIGARDVAFEIRHLQVHRDVCYRSFNLGPTRRPGEPSLERFPGWGTATNPILLREDPPDFFCCGDNSPQSKDSRLWVDVCPTLRQRNDYQYGTVPGDQLIGRAFFVYWPSGLRFSKETPAVIPNVGRLRMIR